MIKKRTYGAFILILAGSLTACSGGANSGGTKGQMLSAIEKDKSAVVTDTLTLTFPKKGTSDLVDYMAQSKADQYIADNYLLLTKVRPSQQGSLLKRMKADGYVTVKGYLVTPVFPNLYRFTEDAGMGPNDVFVYFLTKKGKEYFSKDVGDLLNSDSSIDYLVKVDFYKEIPDHVVDYSVPSGNSGQSMVSANVDFRVAKDAPNDIFKAVKKLDLQSGGKVPKIGSYIKHSCVFTKMSDGYELNGCN